MQPKKPIARAKAGLEFDDPETYRQAAQRIYKKRSLFLFYCEMYEKFSECLSRCPKEGLALELGSGFGFSKKRIPELKTSDIQARDGLDLALDARQLPFPDGAVRALFLFNVFHHIPDVELFLQEAQRVLCKGGKLFLVDQHSGFLGSFILGNLHHEPFDSRTPHWHFDTTGPMSGANGAMCWIVFQRDSSRFEKQFPNLKLTKYKPHSPVRYWLSGGLRAWTLIPGFLFPFMTLLDRWLIRLHSGFGTFVDVEVEKQ